MAALAGVSACNEGVSQSGSGIASTSDVSGGDASVDEDTAGDADAMPRNGRKVDPKQTSTSISQSTDPSIGSAIEVEQDPEKVQPPANITGMYLTCGLPLGDTASSVKIGCRVERDGRKVDDASSRAQWSFRSLNSGLPKPSITPQPNADWQVEFAFTGVASLSPLDLRGSVVELSYAADDRSTEKLSVTYREECNSFKPESQACAPLAPEDFPMINVRSTSTSDRFLVEWDPLVAPAAGVVVVKSAPGSGELTFRPVKGQRYVAGTSYGDEKILYVGSATSLGDPEVSDGVRFTYSVFPFDEAYNYGVGAWVSRAYEKP